MGYARKVAYNTIIQVAGRFGTTIVSLAMVAILNSYLGKEGWGSYYAIITYAGFFAVFADLGINTLFLRELSRYPEKGAEITGKFTAFRLTSATALLSLAPISAIFIPVYQPLVIPILLASASQFLLVANQLLVSILQANLTMDRAIASDLIGRIITLTGIVVAFSMLPKEHALLAVLLISIVGNAATLAITYFFARKRYQILFTLNITEWPSLLKQTLPMAALAVLGVIHFKVDSLILMGIKGDVDVGIYGNAYKIIEIALVLPGIFVGSLIPALNQAYIQKDPKHGAFVQKAFDVLVFAAVPFVTALFVFAAPLMRVLTEHNVEASALSLRILSFAIFSWFLGTLFSNILLAADGQKQLTLVELFAVIFNISLNIFAISRLSYVGAAYTTVITEALSLTAVAYLSWRLLKRLPTGKIFWKSTMLAAPLGVIVWIIEQQLLWVLDSRITAALWLALAGLTFVVTYSLLAILLRMLPPVLMEKISWLTPR